jgi:hypothetical protein
MNDMNNKKLRLGLILTFLGVIGITTMLTMDIPIPLEVQEMLQQQLTPLQIKLLLLLNPTILLIIAVVVGTILYEKVQLRVPIIEKVAGIPIEQVQYSQILKYGIWGGVSTGIILSIVTIIFKSLSPLEFQELGQTLQPTLAARFLYGGFTEEILLRFGLMTLIVWLASKIFTNSNTIPYWTGIILSSLLFAFAHFPVAFQSVENPSFMLLSYILFGNSIGGLVFGWLYWKKGLESAFLAHIFAHVVFVVSELI